MRFLWRSLVKYVEYYINYYVNVVKLVLRILNINTSVILIYYVVTLDLNEDRHKSMHLLPLNTLTFNSPYYYNISRK